MEFGSTMKHTGKGWVVDATTHRCDKLPAQGAMGCLSFFLIGNWPAPALLRILCKWSSPESAAIMETAFFASRRRPTRRAANRIMELISGLDRRYMQADFKSRLQLQSALSDMILHAGASPRDRRDGRRALFDEMLAEIESRPEGDVHFVHPGLDSLVTLGKHENLCVEALWQEECIRVTFQTKAHLRTALCVLVCLDVGTSKPASEDVLSPEHRDLYLASALWNSGLFVQKEYVQKLMPGWADENTSTTVYESPETFMASIAELRKRISAFFSLLDGESTNGLTLAFIHVLEHIQLMAGSKRDANASVQADNGMV